MTMDIDASPVQILRRFLEASNWTQRELADAYGVTDKTISRWMNGGPGLSERKLRQVFKKLNVDGAKYGLKSITTAPPPVDTLTPPGWYLKSHYDLNMKLDRIIDLLEGRESA